MSYCSDAESQQRRGRWSFLFPLYVYYKALYSSLRLCSEVYCIALVTYLYVSFNNRHRIACLLPSLPTLHYYFVLILRVTATVEPSDD